MTVLIPTTTRRHKKSRKHGQNKKKPCHVRYTAERRWIHHKAARIKKNNSKAEYVRFCATHGLHIAETT